MIAKVRTPFLLFTVTSHSALQAPPLSWPLLCSIVGMLLMFHLDELRMTLRQIAFRLCLAVEPERAADGSVGIRLERDVVDRLRHLRGPGEDYSDVILRLADGVRVDP